MKAPPFPKPENITTTIKINTDEIPDIVRKQIGAAGAEMMARFFADPEISKKIDERIAQKRKNQQGGLGHV